MIVADHARRDEGVQQFRSDVLRGRLLTVSEAEKWIRRNRRGSGTTRIRRFGAGSGALTQLEELASYLAGAYGWLYTAAERFVLTGDPPLVFAVGVEFATRPRFPVLSRMVLTIDPAVPPRELAQMYSRLRGIYSPHRKRRLGVKHARLAEFGFAKPTDEPWKETLARWNFGWPKDRYTQMSNFRRDCRRAERRLLGLP